MTDNGCSPAPEALSNPGETSEPQYRADQRGPAGAKQPAARPWPIQAYVRLSAKYCAVGVLLGAFLWLVLPRKYTSTCEVIVASNEQFQLPGALAAFQDQIGLLSSEQTTSPHFIASLLTSRDVLTAVVRDSFRIDHEPDTPRQTLVQILTGKSLDDPADLARGREKLDESITTSVDMRTSILTLSVELSTPELAQDVNRALMRESDRVNSMIQRTQAGHSRAFAEQRLEIAQRELTVVDEAQRDFFLRNVLWQQSPELVLEQQRLQRQIDIRQELTMALARDVEQALQNEFSTMPSLSIVVAPDLPWERSWPSGLLLVLGSLGGGLTFATLVTFLAVGAPADGAHGNPAKTSLPRMALASLNTWYYSRS